MNLRDITARSLFIAHVKQADEAFNQTGREAVPKVGEDVLVLPARVRDDLGSRSSMRNLIAGGAGAGAVAGAAVGALSSKQKRLKHALLGALAGAGLGGTASGLMGTIPTKASAYSGLNVQSYLPINKKRELSGDENKQIEEGSGQVIPRIFTSDADNPSVDMSSPGWGAAGGATIGAGLGAAGGAMLGAGDHARQKVLATLGALLGGGIGGVVGYKGRKANNATIRDRVSRLPEGATRRDIEADPLYQRRQDRAAAMAASMGQGGSAGLALSLLR